MVGDERRWSRSTITAETDAAIRGDLTKGREAQPPIYTQSHLSNSSVAHAALKAEASADADVVMPAIREAQAAGAKSLRQIAFALNRRGVATARGGKWEAATVANVLKRVAA